MFDFCLYRRKFRDELLKRKPWIVSQYFDPSPFSGRQSMHSRIFKILPESARTSRYDLAVAIASSETDVPCLRRSCALTINWSIQFFWDSFISNYRAPKSYRQHDGIAADPGYSPAHSR